MARLVARLVRPPEKAMSGECGPDVAGALLLLLLRLPSAAAASTAAARPPPLLPCCCCCCCCCCATASAAAAVCAGRICSSPAQARGEERRACAPPAPARSPPRTSRGRRGLRQREGGKRDQGQVQDVGGCHSFASSSARGGALILLRPLRGRRRELRTAGGGLGSARKRHLSGSSVECERGARRRVSEYVSRPLSALPIATLYKGSASIHIYSEVHPVPTARRPLNRLIEYNSRRLRGAGLYRRWSQSACRSSPVRMTKWRRADVPE